MSKVFTNMPQFKVHVIILDNPKIGLNLVHIEFILNTLTFHRTPQQSFTFFPDR